MAYIYNDEDNEPMSDFDFHNPPCYLDEYEAKMYDKYGDPDDEDKPDPGCWNCTQYDGNACMKEWNNLDPCYYIPDRDDKDPQDYCEDHETDHDAVWEDFFGGNEP